MRAIATAKVKRGLTARRRGIARKDPNGFMGGGPGAGKLILWRERNGLNQRAASVNAHGYSKDSWLSIPVAAEEITRSEPEENLRAKPDREWTRISNSNTREEKRRTADKLRIYADKSYQRLRCRLSLTTSSGSGVAPGRSAVRSRNLSSSRRRALALGSSR